MACSAPACGAFDVPVHGLPEQESPDAFGRTLPAKVEQHRFEIIAAIDFLLTGI
jgi:hypothetical protein